MKPTIDYVDTMRRKWEAYASSPAGTITVVALANRNIPRHEQAMLQTCERIPFKCKMLMISPTPPRNPDIEWVQDYDWGDGRKQAFTRLGEWTVKRLVNYITTDAVIIVQSDGHATCEKAWTNEFLQWDYIGAPWPLWATLFMRGSMARRVGGGGFSFRSKKFLEATASIDYSPDDYWQEDICTSRVYHKQLEALGCRFAPVAVAMKWCTEYPIEDYPFWKPSQSFGFHGVLKTGKPYYTLNPALAFWNAVKLKLTGMKS
jgi:hypothetical protein